VALLVVGLAFFSAGGCASEQPLGCQKDTDCATGRICESGACTWAPNGAAGSSGTSCAETGETCSVNGDCCNFQHLDGFCVSGTCADHCGADGECQSNCCARTQNGERACAPQSICEEVCVETGQSCSVNDDCCNYRDGAGYCVDGICADTCCADETCDMGASEQCASGCCAGLQGGDWACAPAEYCP